MRTRDLSANNINTLDSRGVFGSANNATCILCLDNAFVCIQNLHLRIPPRVLHFSAIHFLVWLELGRTAKNSRKQKRTIRRWRFDKFGDDVVRQKYCEALQAEVEAFSEGISQMEEGGMRGNELVEGVLKEWENIVNRVARDTVGEKVIVCGRPVRWWDDEIKAKIEQRRQLYKRMVRGQEGLWDEYNKLRREVKHLVMEKKLNVWNGVVEKANADFEGNKKGILVICR